MKSTGIVRKVDELGRIVIPKELRTILDIKERDALEIYTENEMIILKKYAVSCAFCDEASDLVKIEDKNICPKCIKRISEEMEKIK